VDKNYRLNVSVDCWKHCALSSSELYTSSMQFIMKQVCLQLQCTRYTDNVARIHPLHDVCCVPCSNQSISVSISALEVFLNDMRYINPRFTYLLTYLSPASRATAATFVAVAHVGTDRRTDAQQMHRSYSAYTRGVPTSAVKLSCCCQYCFCVVGCFS